MNEFTKYLQNVLKYQDKVDIRTECKFCLYTEAWAIPGRRIMEINSVLSQNRLCPECKQVSGQFIEYIGQ